MLDMPTQSGEIGLSVLISAATAGTVLLGSLGMFQWYQPPNPEDTQAAQQVQPVEQNDDLVFEISQTDPVTPAPQGRQAQFIVRVQGVDAIDECLRLYYSDRPASYEMFREWAKGHSELVGFKLVRANYSGELILSYTPQAGGRSISAAQQELLNLEQVRYADLDHIVSIEEN